MEALISKSSIENNTASSVGMLVGHLSEVQSIRGVFEDNW